LGIAAGFALEWVIELLVWRGRSSGKSATYELETELQAAKREVAVVRSGSEFQGLQSNLDTALHAKSDLEAKLKKGSLELADVNAKFAALQADFGKLQVDQKLKLGEIATLTAGSAVASAALKGKDVEWGKLKLDWEGKLNAKDAELTSLKADWEGRLKAKDAELSKLKLDWESKVNAKDLELSKLSADWDAKFKAAEGDAGKYQAQFATLQSDHGGKLTEIATLTAGAAAAAAMLKSKDGELAKLKADYSLKLGELDTLTATAAVSSVSIKAKDAEIARGQAELGKLKTDFNLKLGEIATLTAGSVAAGASIKAKDAELGKLQINLGDANARFANLQADFGKLNGDNAKLTLTIQDLQKELGSLRGQLKAALDDGSTQKTTFASFKADFDGLKTDHGSKLAEIATLTAGAVAAAAAIKSKDGEIGTLKGRLGELEAALKTKDADAAKLTADWNTKFKLKDGEIATFTAGAAAAAAAIKAKEDELGKLRVQIGTLEASVKAKDAEIARGQSDLAGANTKFTTLIGDFDASKVGTAKLDADLKGALGAKADLEVKLKAKDAEIAKGQSELAKLTADWDAKLKLKDGEVATLVAGSAASSASIKAKDDELGKLKSRVGDLDAQLVKLRLDWEGKLKASADALAKANADVEAKKGDHGRTLAEIATLTAGAAATAAAIKGKDDELKALRLRIAGLEADLKAKDTDLSGWNTKFMSLQGDFDNFKVTSKGSDDELAKLRARIGSLEDELNKANYARGTFEASLKSRDLHVSDLQAELAKLRDADAAKSTQISTFMSSANSAGDAIKAREQELAAANTRFAALDKNWNDAKWRIGELEAELGKVRGASSDYEARIAGLDKSANDAKWRIGELEAELASLRAARMEVEGDLNARIARVGELEAELAELRARPVAVPQPAKLTQAFEAAAPVTLMKADKGFAEAAASEAGVEIVRTECPQHLSEIDGIGTVFEQRLFEYGIGTYFEVANLSDEEFRKALKLDEIAKASKTGSKMLKIDLNAIRKDAMRLAKETGTLGRTWLGGQPDDFEPIDGIGHVFELRLYNAGICTYEALIKAGAARLAEIVQPPTSKRPARFKAPDYEGWIEQAIELMNKRNKAASGSSGS
jgi:chromosome segregation ATPase